MVEQARKASRNGLWEHHVESLRSLARNPDRPAFAAPGWSPVTHATAESRGRGEPPAHWTASDSGFTHDAGHANDFLYLNTPLRGDFQVDCELTARQGRELRLSNCGTSVGPKHDMKEVEVMNLGRELAAVAIHPPLAPPGDWYRYRLVVRGDRATSFVNDRKVHEWPLSADRDPWLALHSAAGLNGSVRHVKISGEPTVPESLDLSAPPDLAGWTADSYHETLTGQEPDWKKLGSEIVGQARRGWPGSRQESVLRYNRPLLEDGTITYEFFYVPGKVLTHPAIDRLTFLLEPQGVKTHWLTDAPYERTNLTSDNTSAEPEARREPASLSLKPDAWNKVVLTLKGDKATLTLNGDQVAERLLEPTNQRVFGLFHYADETEARVRNMTYRGEWPKTLPASVRAADATTK